MVKKGIRVLGVDDFNFCNSWWLIGVVYKLSGKVDGILLRKIKKDGKDATEKLIDMILNSRFGKTINVLISSGITYAGFNYLDVEEFYRETKVPVIIVISKKPNFEKIWISLRKFKDRKERFEAMKKAGEIKKMKNNGGFIYFQHYGISEEDARKIIRISSLESKVPEPIRLAHIIGSGIENGESKKKI